MLSVPDAKLEWHHFRKLLGPYSPAGTYEEVVYFLPLAFDYIIAHDDDALDLVTSLVWFVSEYDEKLRRDRIRNAARERIHDCLSHWSSQFRIIHFDFDACRAKEWVIPYQDCVEFSEVICQCTEDLVRFRNHADLAVQFFEALASNKEDATKAAWLLEMARARNDVYTPPDEPKIQSLLSNRQLLANAVASVRRELFQMDSSPTYWTDTFAALDV